MKRFAFLVVLLSAGLASADAPFQFNGPNLQVPTDPVVNGVRFSIFHGENQRVGGFDLGLLSVSEAATFSGLSFVAGVHRVTGEMTGGAAISLINYHTGSDAGVNAAFINKLNHSESAFNLSFLNIADGNTAFDLGGLNMANRSTAQVGFINIAKEIKSFQFGFLNIADNGFFRVFPVFNFPKN